MSIKTIFFDASNTLYSSPELTKKMKAAPIDFIMRQNGISKEAASILFEDATARVKEKSAPLTKTNILVESGFNNSDFQDFIASINVALYLSPIEENVNTLTWLSTKYDLGIITNINNKYLQKVLEAIGLSNNLFSHFITADDVSKAKPDLEPFLAAINRSGENPEQIIYIGDQIKKDMEPAKKSGMKTVLVDYKNQYNKSDEDAVDYCIHSLGELMTVIDVIEKDVSNEKGKVK